MKIYQVSLKREKPQLILANGSERGEFVPMEDILTKMGRIHDGIQLMKTYYPHDPKWSSKYRISEITDRNNVTYAWDYEYEDYYPYDIWEQDSKTRNEIEQIKCSGSDLHLTLTLDLGLSENEIVEIVKSLQPFGRVFLRINHEVNGDWFRFNRQHTLKEVSDFFVRCHKIIKNNAANIFTVFNLSADQFVNEKLVKEWGLRLGKDQLKDALEIADYWSIDKYTSLHYGWPFENELVEETKQFFRGTAADWWQLVEETYLKMIWHNDLKAKPLFINEFNCDSNVDGYGGQAAVISNVYNRLANGEFDWLAGIVLYQFRDHGGLGLEKGNLQSYTSLPSLTAYQQAIKEFKYQMAVNDQELTYPDYTFSWTDSDNIRGIILKNLTGKEHFVNRFNFPVYLVHGNEQLWSRIEKNDRFQLNGLDEFILLVPPFLGRDQMISFSTVIRNIRGKIEDMIA